MAVAALAPFEEYLAISYEANREYVEGRTLTSHGRAESHTYRDLVTTSDGAISPDLTDLFRKMKEDEAN